MSRIVVIEDESDIGRTLEYNLKQAGYEVLLAETGRIGLSLVREHRPDLILLDVMLPDISGLEVCRTLRNEPLTRMTPIVMVTARTAETDRVVAFELGVDDYLTKPFSMRELLLRVRAILRRHRAPQAEEGIIDFGALRIDRAAHRVWVCGDEVELTLLEFKLLLTLFERKNRVQTRLALLDDVWGVDSKISPRSVDAHVKRLRERLGAARDYIETVRGVGYRFINEPADCACQIPE
jgi:two-component system phosphate regulon response regulator PhoB